ncbi:hypothetical protein GOODEAATRI_034337, partial [Goodea atripinnis]
LVLQQRVGILLCRASQTTADHKYNSEIISPALNQFLNLLSHSPSGEKVLEVLGVSLIQNLQQVMKVTSDLLMTHQFKSCKTCRRRLCTALRTWIRN